MGTRIKGRLSLLLLSFAVVMLIFPAMAFAQDAGGSGGSSSPAPTIQSDKDDYAPGETVTLTGSNWQPGETVNINVNDDEGSTWNRNVDVTADENGAIRDEFQLPDWLVATYKVTATGAQSGVATTSFTDGNIVIKAAPPGTNFNGTFTEFNGTNCTGTASSPVSRSSTDTPADPVGSANSNDFSQAVPNTSSLKIEASAHNSAGNGFKDFTAEDPADSSRIIENGSFDPASSPRIICINGAFTGGKTFFVNYFPNNQAPVNSVPAAQITNEDTAKVFNTANNNVISISDPDANPTSSVKVTLSVTHGTLTLSGTSGLSFTTGDGTNDANMTFTGTISNINTALNGMSFTPNANFFGPSPLTIITDDQGNTGTGGAKSDSDTVNITVNPVNDAPVAEDQSVTTDEDVAKDITLGASDVEGDALTYHIDSGPSHGELSGTGANRTYTPDPDYHGPDSFTFKVNDGTDDSNVAEVSITVNPVNDAPVADDDAYEVNEDGELNIDAPGVLGNDADVDGDSLTAAKVVNSGPANGTLDFNADGSFTYTPNANFNGSDSFEYKANDGTADSNVAKVTITVKAVNDAPVATDDNGYETDEDEALEISAGDLLANDDDVDGDNLSISDFDAESAEGGTVSRDNGTFTYTPAQDFYGSDSFTYTVSDGNGGTDSATVSITVRPVNDTPVAVDDTDATDEDTALSIDVVANDTDVDNTNAELSVSSFDHTSAQGGTVSQNNDGTLKYEPAANYNGPDTFTYKVSDGSLESNNAATVTVTVREVNDAPVAKDDSAETDEDVALVIEDANTLAANDDKGAANENGQTLTVNQVSNATHGTVSLDNGKITFTPDENYFGPASFDYQVCDDGTTNGQPDPKCDTGTVSITVRPVNDAPVADNDSYVTDEDTKLTVLAADGLLKNDDDIENDTLHVEDADPNEPGINPVSGPANGTLTLNADGSFEYMPDANYNGSDSFDYRVCDNGSPEPKCSVETAKVTITINPVNDAPVAVDDTAETDEDTAVDIAVLTNDTDVDNTNAELSVSSFTQAAHGTVSQNNDGTLKYRPNSNYFGPDSFTYKASDGSLESENAATVRINVRAVNDPPVAVDDTVETNEDVPADIDVLGNDEDVENDALSVSSFTQASHGTVSQNNDGTLKYTPEADYYGPDSFTYKANDGTDDSNVATVRINVKPVNDEPVAHDDTATTPEDTPVEISPSELLGNDSAGPDNESGQQLTISAVSNSQHGQAVLNSDGSVTFTPAANFYGLASFEYTVCDDGSPQKCSVETATVRVTVSPVNDAPVATGDAYQTNEDGELNIAAPGVLANDEDVENDTLTAVLVDGPAHGDLTLNADGSFTYTPDPNYHGPDSFTYKANDGTVDSNVATVSITVSSVNDDPTVKTPAADDTGKNEGATLSTQGAFQDAADNDTLTITKTDGAGTVVDNHDGTWSWSLQTRDNISGSVTVTATDGKGGTVSDTFNYSTINVPPAAFNPTFLFNPVLGTATAGFDFSDAGFDDRHLDSYFTWSDVGIRPALVGPEPNGAGHASDTRTLNPGCYNLTVTGTAKDDDGGASAPLTLSSSNTQTSVHGRGFLPPIMDNERNIAKYGNVVPVKVQLTNSCTGGTVTNANLYITIHKGSGGEVIEDTNVIAESVSSADNGQQMRVVDGRYMYNLSTRNMTANSDWTVRVRLDSTTGPILLQAVFYPKK